MIIEIIIAIIVLGLIGILMFKLTKSIFKAIFLASSALSIIVIIFGFFVFTDSLDFQKNFKNQSSIYLLESEDQILTGFTGILGENFEPTFIQQDDLDSYTISNLKKPLGSNYKLFLISKEALIDVQNIEGGGDLKLTGDEILNVIESNTAIDEFIRVQVGYDVTEDELPTLRKSLTQQMNIENDAELKATLFLALFGTSMEQQGPLYLFEKINDKTIKVYPETAVFNFLKRIPISLVAGSLIKIQEGDNQSES